jgi:hypothetical protein
MQDAAADQRIGTPAAEPPLGGQEPTPVASARVRQPRRSHRARLSLTAILVFVLLALGFGYLTLAYTGKTVQLPVLAVAEVETRLNAGLVGSSLPPGAAVALGAVEFSVDASFVPRFRLADIRLLDVQGRSLLTLPEAEITLDPRALMSGQLRLGSVRLIGARLAVRRDRDGRLDLQFGGANDSAGPQNLGEMLGIAEATLAAPALSSLTVIEAEGLTLTLTDERAARTWQVGDGRLVIENRPDAIVAELGLTLLDGEAPAQANLKVVVTKGGGAARLAARIDTIASGDLAALAPPLAWLSAVKAPISGQLVANISEDGFISGLSADLAFAAGSISPGKDARPIGFDAADMSLSYDPVTARLTLTDLTVESTTLRLRAKGHGDLLAADGGPAASGDLPQSVLAQMTFSQVMIDPDGQFTEPVRFGEGALDLRLYLAPFRLEIGQLALAEGDERLLLSGALTAGDGGWDGALDVQLNQIAADRLLKVWPMSVVAKTRVWFADNVGQGLMYNVRAALRLKPGGQPQFSLGYEFANTDVRLVRTLPRVIDARGHATFENRTYTVSLNKGHLIAPEGGQIDVDGSVFQILDITERPANVKIDLISSSSLTATLSLLDQEPFSFFSKAGQPVNLGDGRAMLTTTLKMPLKPKVGLDEVSFVVAGRIVDFTSPSLVPGRILTAPEVSVAVDNEGLQLGGVGMLDLLPVDLTYLQGFGSEQKGRARINGTVMLSDAALRNLGVELPEGAITGEGPAAIDIALVKDLPPQLTLTSNLVGLALRMDALGWSKAAKTKGALDLEARLAREPVVERMSLSAPGLDVEGRITTLEGGGLAEARFSRVRAGDWLDGPVVLTGNGTGRAFDVSVTGGTIDMRAMPGGKGGPAGGPVTLALDGLRISEGITLTGFRGDFGGKGGLNGTFTAGINGKAEINGVVAPAKGGSAIRITSDNAGAVMAAAGIFDQGRGGTLDLKLTPRGPEGEYNGKATFSRMRIQGAPALAELLSAVSIVGLLEQMNGEGLAFNNGEVDFILTPNAVEITKGSAVGASLGISFAGLYLSGSGAIDLQGVISPIYLVNGIGQIFSKKGEGLFGFNYRLTGTTDDPNVSVNPLSVLTPGMFREIFRQAPPNLQDASE